ncbi:MAG: glycosyltransferase family 4 protein, partial [Bdellovibrionales bacterium]|nr:glycosyltransferase family 4 protein [Bdellovibrionales bacterium]
VGNLEARKNVIGLLKAFEIFCQESSEKNIKLYIIGKEGFGAREIKEFYQSMTHQSRVKFLGFVTNNELKEFYQSALALVYPSFYEGFGIPLLEAMIHQCPIITSHRTSTKEIAGDAALLVDPFRSEDIAAAMVRLVSDVNIVDQLKRQGALRVKKFTWEQCAQKTLNIYEQVGSSV